VRTVLLVDFLILGKLVAHTVGMDIIRPALGADLALHVQLEDMRPEAMARAHFVLLVDTPQVGPAVALHALQENILTEELVRALVSPVLPVGILQHAATAVRTVLLVDILIPDVLVAHTVVMGPIRQALVAHLAFHVQLEDTRGEVMAPVQTVRLVDTPQLGLVVVLTVLLVNTPRSGLVRAPRVPLVNTLHVDGADVITALLEGTQVPALVDARTALMASIRRLHADPRV
jgi:hypothetical protein